MHKTQRKWQSWPLVAMGLVGLAACTPGQPTALTSSTAASSEELVAVDAEVAATGEFEDSLTFTGTTQPLQVVTLRSRVDGQITLLTVDVGDRVAAEEAIARLDADLLTVAVNQAQAELQARRSEVAQARAAVSDAQTDLESARVQLQQAQTEANRLSSLASEGAVSVQTAEQAQLTVDTGQQVLQSANEQIRTRQEAVRAAEGRVAAQQAVVDQAAERLSYAVVRSPLAGVVMQRFVDTGDYAETGDELLQIGDLSRLKAVIEVADRNLSAVAVGQPVEVQLDALPEQSFSGRITRIAPVAAPASRLIPVEITLPNPDNRIGSGLLARVALAAGDRLSVPQRALDLAERESPTVFVLTERDETTAIVQARAVEVGEAGNQRVEILSGLRAGEAYVVRSSGDLSDGQTVKLSILSETE
ncbi:MAG: efflux RND transporter periplasmic adaptor subunit [Leptolyngbyaceae cyanobacterium]